jgi:hypothetical protein
MSASPYNLLFQRVNATSDAANTVVTGTAGHSIVVVNYALNANAAGVITIQDSAGSPAVYASFELTDGGGVSFAGTWDAPAFKVAEGLNLVISNAAGVDTLGHLAYYLKRGRG